MEKLERLCNSLIKRWRVPFGESRIDKINRAEQYVWNWNWCCWGGAMQKRKSTRQLVSKESWLWQFVCENKMIPYDEDWYTWYERTKDYYDDFENSNSKMLGLAIDNWYEYRLIESALKDESELEDFLLQNIKVWNKTLKKCLEIINSD